MQSLLAFQKSVPCKWGGWDAKSGEGHLNTLLRGVKEVKCEPSVSFDYSKSEMNSMRRKRLNWVLEIKEEHPKKQSGWRKRSEFHLLWKWKVIRRQKITRKDKADKFTRNHTTWAHITAVVPRHRFLPTMIHRIGSGALSWCNARAFVLVSQNNWEQTNRQL